MVSGTTTEVEARVGFRCWERTVNCVPIDFTHGIIDRYYGAYGFMFSCIDKGKEKGGSFDTKRPTPGYDEKAIIKKNL